MESNKEQLMVIDTDGGADDALAILLALDQQPIWKVLAVTTVHGNVNVDKAAETVVRVLNFANRADIPVYKGCHTGILYEFQRDNFYGEDGLSGYSSKYPLPNGYKMNNEMAVNALIRLIKEYPKQITVVCLGPLSNVAMAHRLDRSFADNIYQLFIMGGNLRGDGNVTTAAEFNFMSDCEAAEITVSEFKCPKIIITWEACEDHKQSWEWYDKWISKGTGRSDFAGRVLSKPVEFKKRVGTAGFNCCDLLAMTAVVHPKIILKTENRYARVELQGKHTRGMMVIERRLWSPVDQLPNINLHTVYNKDTIKNIWDKLTD